MTETERWQRTFTYYDEPGACDMVHMIVNNIINLAKDTGKIDKVVGEPSFITIPDPLVPNFYKVKVAFEFIAGPNLKRENAGKGAKRIGYKFEN